VYQYSVPANQCDELSEIDAVIQSCSFSEDDYDYAFFDPPPGMPAAGTYNLDDVSCSPVYSFGQMTFDWSFISADPSVAGYSSSLNGVPVSDNVPVSLQDSAGVQTARLHVNYVGGNSDDWTFRFTTTAPATIQMVQAPFGRPGLYTEAVLSVKNNLPRETPLELTISQPPGWTTMVLGDNVPAVGPGGQIQVRLGINPPANSPNGTFPLTFTVESAQGKQRRFNVPVQVSNTVDVEAGSPASTLSLSLNAPNPMRSSTRISYVLPKRSFATITIYDLGGRSVKQIFSGFQEGGHHQVTWDAMDEMGREVPAGVYVYALEVGSERRLRKLLVIR